MLESGLIQQINQKETDKRKVVEPVIQKPELLSDVISGLSTDKARIKYGCAKILRIISQEKPEILYPQIDFFIDLLDSSKTILKWNAIIIIANLASVDSENKLVEIFDRYFGPISGSVLITAANIIGGAAKIALAKPELTAKITKELLKVETAGYQTTECRNIALGHVIKAFDRFYAQIEEKEPVNELVTRQLENTRNATRKTAEKFVKKRLARL